MRLLLSVPFALCLLPLVGCSSGGGGGGDGGVPTNPPPDAAILRSGAFMFDGVLFAPRNAVNSISDFNEDGLDDLISVAIGNVLSGEGIFIRLGSPALLFGDATYLGRDPRTVDPVAIADFDGDDHLDFAYAGSGLFLQRGHGDGTFDAKETIDVPAGTPSMRTPFATDLDGDHDQDIVVIVGTGSSTTLAAYLNNGHGSFVPQSTLLSNEATIIGSPVDFNGDHLPDVVCRIASSPQTLSLITNSSNGTFAAPIAVMTDTICFGGALGDVNADGNADVVGVTATSIPAIQLVVRLGAGNGTFSSVPAQTATFPGPVLDARYLLDDVTGDGNLDFFAAYALPGWGHVMYEGTGDGTFTNETLMAGTGAHNFVVSDFDRDGLKDIYIGVMFRGVTGGGFGSVPRMDAGLHATTITSLDIDVDSIQDLVVSDANTLTTFLSNGDGTFAPSGSVAVPAVPGDRRTPDSIAQSADFNGDTKPDLVILYSDFLTPKLAVFLNQGDGTMAGVEPAISAAQSELNAVQLAEPADLDGDGATDLLGTVRAGTLQNPGQILVTGAWVMFGNNDGTFGQSTFAFNGTVGGIPVTADLNGDGLRDVLVQDIANGVVRVIHAQADRSFTSGPAVPGTTVDAWTIVAAGRLDDDTMDDFVVFGDDNILSVYYGNSAGGIDAGDQFELAGALPTGVKIVQLDGAGTPFIVASRRTNTLPAGSVYHATVTVLRPAGTRHFEIADEVGSEAGVGRSTQIVDFTSDGFADLVTPSEGVIEVLRGQGDGNLEGPLFFDFAPTTNNDIMAVGDWDDDGDVDLAVPVETEILIVQNHYE